MNNSEVLRNIFSQTLKIDVKQVIDSLKYNTIPEWDSKAHLILIAAIDDHFDIMMDTEDIIDMSTFKKAKEILTKYDVVF